MMISFYLIDGEGKRNLSGLSKSGRERLEVRTLRTGISPTDRDKNLRFLFPDPSKEAGPQTS